MAPPSPGALRAAQVFCASAAVGARCSVFFQLKHGAPGLWAGSRQSSSPASKTAHWREKRMRGANAAACCAGSAS
eukprot:scaffold7837_cov89-Isochrysis_galbana.AAC.2